MLQLLHCASTGGARSVALPTEKCLDLHPDSDASRHPPTFLVSPSPNTPGDSKRGPGSLLARGALLG